MIGKAPESAQPARIAVPASRAIRRQDDEQIEAVSRATPFARTNDDAVDVTFAQGGVDEALPIERPVDIATSVEFEPVVLAQAEAAAATATSGASAGAAAGSAAATTATASAAATAAAVGAGISTATVIGAAVGVAAIGAAASSGGSDSDAPANQAPTFAASPVALAVTEDTAKTGKATATDPEGKTLAYSITGTASHGVVTLDNTTGDYTYTPNANYSGADTFKITAKDPSGATVEQTINVTVTAVNDAPVYASASVAASGSEDVAVNGTAAATDVDNATLAYAVKTQAAHGSVSVNATTGAYTYTPAKDYNGADSFVVSATDAAGASAQQTVNVTLAAVNDAPTLNAASTTSITVRSGSTAAIVIDASDVDNADSALQSSIVTAPAHGQITVGTNGQIYTPAAGYVGTDSFVVRVIDGAGGVTEYTVPVTVTAANVAPVYANASVAASGTEDAPVTGTAVATDANGDAIAYAVATQAEHGTVAVNATTGAYTYTPAKDYAGSDSFVVRASDASGASGQQTVNVTVAAVNDAPSFAAASVSASGTEDVAVTGTVSATDVDSASIAYAVKTEAAHGTVTVNATSGAYTYTPAKDYAGADSFVVSATDGAGASAQQTVNVTLAAVNDAPVVAATSVAVNGTEDVAVTGTVAATDVDNASLAYAVKTAAAHGTVTVDASTGAYTYTPTKDYAGADSFVVSVTDAAGASAEQAINVTLAAVNDAPVITSGATASVAENASATTVVYTATATDVDNATGLTYSLAGTDAAALSIDAASGAVRLRASADFETKSSYSFSVVATDSAGAAATKAVALSITDVVENSPSLDVDNDASTATQYLLSAAAGAIQYIENPTVSNNVGIQNFGLDDTITVQGDASGYGFTSRNGNIEITFNNTSANALNQVTLLGVNVTGLVYNEATAEAALGKALGLTGSLDFFQSTTAPTGGSTATGGTLDADDDSSLLTARALDAGTGVVAYTESGKVSNTVAISNFGSGDTITVLDGSTGDYSFTSRNGNIEITYNNVTDSALSAITLVGKAGTSLITNEASAEAALGYDFFKSIEMTATVAIDLDDDANLSTARVFDASGAAKTFTEDGKVSNTIAINNFSTGDTILVSNANSGNYSFTARNGNIEIVFNNTATNTLSSITLLGRAGTGLVYNEATAESAVGFDFFRFA